MKKPQFGLWWLPHSPERKLAGTLQYDLSGELSLHLDKELTKQTQWDLKTSREPVILGEGSRLNSFKTTLVNSLYFFPTVYSSRLMLQGKHYNSLEEIKEPKLLLDIPGLQEWYGQFGTTRKNRRKADGASIHYSRPDPVIVESKRLPFEISIGLTQRSDKFHEGITQYCNAVFTDDRGIDLDTYHIAEQWLSEFLSFVFQKKCVARKACYISPATGAQSHSSTIKIIRGKPEEDTSSDKALPEPVFYYEHVKHRIATMWDKWLLLEQDFRPVIHYYLASATEHTPYVFHEILNLSLALEYYHREHCKRGRRKAFRVKVWNKDKTRKYNASLKTRFEDLWDYQPQKIKSLLGDKDLFCQMAADARHHYTHHNTPGYTTDLPKEVALVSKLQIMLTSILLKELGFSHSEINLLASNTRTPAFRIASVI